MLRRLLQSSLLALVAATPFTARAASAAGSLEVVAVQPSRVADLVLLGHGFDAGLRQGMVCRVTRGNADIAEILLVEVRPTCSAALITSLVPAQSIHAGDAAAVKILKT
jgi:hypothetical protein